MTKPRYVRAGQTTMAQTRTYRGEYRFVPSTEVNQIIEYSLARAAQLSGVELHEFGVMLNHDHVLSRDSQGTRPKFFRIFHELVARALNRKFGERDHVYSRRAYTDPVLLTPECVLEKCVYVLANPVKHGYVRYERDWGGVSSYAMEYGVPKRIRRPDEFFSKDMPESIDLVITRPPDLHPELSDHQLRRVIRERVADRTRELRGEFQARGKVFLGMQRVRRLSRRSAPDYGPLRAGRRSDIRPKVAGGTAQMRRRFLEIVKDFVESYERTLARVMGGDLLAVFPAGTYRMRLLGLHAEPP